LDRKRIFWMVPLLLLMATCRDRQDDLQARLQADVDRIRDEHVPDRRLDIFNVGVEPQGRSWRIAGETSVHAAREALQAVARDARVETDVVLVPEEDSGLALIRVSVAPMRGEPRHQAEMVDQLVMGTPVRIMKSERGWRLVQTPYRYLGWVESLMVTQPPPEQAQAWNAGPLARFEEATGFIRAEADGTSLPVADIVMGSIVRRDSTSGQWTRVLLPDGRSGYLPAHSLADVSQANRASMERHRLIARAQNLKGIPYLWGGNSTKGFDCSGFTQTVFKMDGISLPRDANQQVLVGAEVEAAPDFRNVLPGDLLFFGEQRITHVGISLGGGRFIHASGDVHVSSLLERDDGYEPDLRRRLQTIKRVLE
jgi:gamma-D-glutamyl-L-lysine dipeptidyl-peptidase